MTRRVAFLAVFYAALLAGSPLYAGCVNPPGVNGETIYNADHGVMQFCDGASWISMAASGSATEVDPKVGTLESGKWCSSNGTIIACTEDAPVSGAGGSSGQVQYNTGSGLGGAVAATYATSGDLLMLISQAATDIPLTVKGAESQSGNLTEWRDSSGSALVVVDESGNVGIGTASPSEKLQITDGNIRIGETGTKTITVKGDLTGDTSIVLANSSGSFGSSLNLWLGGSAYHEARLNTQNTNMRIGVRGGSIIFNTGDEIDSANERMRIHLSGNVGIGTANPSSALEVAGTVTATTFSGSGASLTTLNADSLASGTVPAARLGGGTADNSTYLRGDQTWASVSSSQWTDGASSAIYYTSGNVGIGATSPKYLLDVGVGSTAWSNWDRFHINAIAANNLTGPAAQKINARASLYSFIAGRNPSTNFSLIIVPWDGSNDLETNCNSQINPYWHAQAVVKGYYWNQAFDNTDFTYYSTVMGDQATFDSFKSYGTQWWIGCSTMTAFSNSGADLIALNADNLASGTVATARLGSGTADNSTYLRGDGTWAALSGIIGGSGTQNYIPKFTGSTTLGNSVIYDNGGNVGIGTANPAGWKLHVNGGNYGIYGYGGTYGVYGYNSAGAGATLAYGGWGLYCFAGSCGGTSAWANVSDARLKTNIKNLEEKDGLAAIMKLRPVRFDWKDKKEATDQDRQFGFVAQEVEVIFPEAVPKNTLDTSITHANGKREPVKAAKTLSYSGLTVPLVKAIQQLKAANDDQAAALKTANDNLAALRALVEKQGRLIETLRAARRVGVVMPQGSVASRAGKVRGLVQDSIVDE